MSMTVGEMTVKRKAQNVRQDTLALRLGWNRETIVDIERGRVQVSEHTLHQMDSAIDLIVREQQQREGVTA